MATTKKRGRPSKAQAAATPKKRGRPPKSTQTTKVSAKKKSTGLLQSNTTKDGHQWAEEIKRLGKAEVIRKYAVTFPNAKAAAIAKAVGVSYNYVQQILWKWRQKQKGIVPVRFLSELDEVKANHKEHVKAHMDFIHAVTSGKSIKDVDMVNHPPHYTQGGIETIDFIEAKKLPYNLGNVIKYITRADHKGNQLEDLQKARWYLDREITRITPPLA